MRIKIFIIACATSFSAFSAELPSDWYVGAMMTHNGKTETEKPDASFGAALKLGYKISPTWAIEASTGYYGRLDMITPGQYVSATTKDARYATDLSLLGNVFLSKRYKFYGGLGGVFENNELSPIAQVGIRYDLTTLWSFNFGYEFLLSNEQESKLQSLLIGGQYNFPTSNSNHKSTPYKTIDVKSETMDSYSKNAAKENNKKASIIKYRIKEGDWMYKIARKNNTTLSEIFRINKKLKRIEDINLIYPGWIIFIPKSKED
ncbi:outer membrane beta-barrel protein [Vibrio jasicida]|uniref:outer membrane beta-barrel protein n=2 Tax=Vibrio jasicida TaxID=766224 RepID=UPI0003AAA89E|nr:outer membrane beta-barrel protein [Vibrio jasicida]